MNSGQNPMATVRYEGDLRCRSIHRYSGNEVISDAPLDNKGRAQAFSPTDMVSASLATCMLTIMGIKARDMELPLHGTSAEVWKTMASNPRRISRIEIAFHMAGGPFTLKDKTVLERVARACPVAQSLHPDIAKDVTFHWP